MTGKEIVDLAGIFAFLDKVHIRVHLHSRQRVQQLSCILRIVAVRWQRGRRFKLADVVADDLVVIGFVQIWNISPQPKDLTRECASDVRKADDLKPILQAQVFAFLTGVAAAAAAVTIWDFVPVCMVNDAINKIQRQVVHGVASGRHEIGRFALSLVVSSQAFYFSREHILVSGLGHGLW